MGNIFSKSVTYKKFPNREKPKFGQELADAYNAITPGEELGPGPYRQGSEEFRAFINSGEIFKWTLSETHGLVVISPTLKHSVPAGGGEVITAGQGQKLADGKIWIDNDTGHYQTNFESLKKSTDVWKNEGYEVEMRNRTDYLGLFK